MEQVAGARKLVPGTMVAIRPPAKPITIPGKCMACARIPAVGTIGTALPAHQILEDMATAPGTPSTTSVRSSPRIAGTILIQQAVWVFLGAPGKVVAAGASTMGAGIMIIIRQGA